MSRRMPPAPIAALLLGLTGVVPSTGQQAPPQTTFRSGVELVLIDVTVLDKDGAQIADLRPSDFTLEVGGRKRTIVAAQFVRSGRAVVAAPVSPTTPEDSPVPPPSFATSVAALASTARTIFVVVDVDNIRSGEGRGAMENLADYFDTLPPTDEIGFIPLPSGTPSLEPTTNRAAIRDLLTRTWGRSGTMRSCDPTAGEAAAHAARDSRGLAAYGQRAINGMGCPGVTRSRIESAIPQYRSQTVALLRNLASFAKGLGERPGRRAIVLVSEGLYGDEDLRPELAAFGEALERARVVLYAIHLDFPFMEAVVKANITLSRTLDDSYGLDAMADAAIAGGGAAMRAISRPTPALRRIDAALSGSYVVAFERSASDSDGKRLGVKVSVNRNGADVRARSHVTINPRRPK